MLDRKLMPTDRINAIDSNQACSTAILSATLGTERACPLPDSKSDSDPKRTVRPSFRHLFGGISSSVLMIEFNNRVRSRVLGRSCRSLIVGSASMRSQFAIAALAIWLVLGGSQCVFAEEPAPSDEKSDRSELPMSLPPFEGKVGETYKESEEDWPKVPTAPQDAPNVVVILLDDVGFGQPSTFGGLIPDPFSSITREYERCSCQRRCISITRRRRSG